MSARAVVLGAAIALLGVAAPLIAASCDANTLKSGVAIGSLYPSGRAYLQFASDANAPDRVSLLPLDAESVDGGVPLAAVSARRVGVVDGLYIPGFEGLDASHDQTCGWAFEEKPGASFAGTDPFRSDSDVCSTESGVWRYQADGPVDVGRAVVAVPYACGAAAATFSGAGRARPADPSGDSSFDDFCPEPAFVPQGAELVSVSLGNAGTVTVFGGEEDGCRGERATLYWVDRLGPNGEEPLALIRRFLGWSTNASGGR